MADLPLQTKYRAANTKMTSKFNKYMYLLELNDSKINFAKNIPTVEQLTIRGPFQADDWTVMCTTDMHRLSLDRRKKITFYHWLLIGSLKLSTRFYQNCLIDQGWLAAQHH